MHEDYLSFFVSLPDLVMMPSLMRTWRALAWNLVAWVVNSLAALRKSSRHSGELKPQFAIVFDFLAVITPTYTFRFVG